MWATKENQHTNKLRTWQVHYTVQLTSLWSKLLDQRLFLTNKYTIFQKSYKIQMRGPFLSSAQIMTINSSYKSFITVMQFFQAQEGNTFLEKNESSNGFYHMTSKLVLWSLKFHFKTVLPNQWNKNIQVTILSQRYEESRHSNWFILKLVIPYLKSYWPFYQHLSRLQLSAVCYLFTVSNSSAFLATVP